MNYFNIPAAAMWTYSRVPQNWMILPPVALYPSYSSMAPLMTCYRTENCFPRVVVARFKTTLKMLTICVEITARKAFVVLQIRCYNCSRRFTLALGHGGDHPMLLYSRVLVLRDMDGLLKTKSYCILHWTEIQTYESGISTTGYDFEKVWLFSNHTDDRYVPTYMVLWIVA